MKGDLLICGGVFTHERLNFHKLLHKDKDFIIRTMHAKELMRAKTKIEGDYVVLLGLKKLERNLRKERMNNKQVRRQIWRFMDRTIPKKIPLIVLDDWTLPTLRLIGNDLRKYLFSNFNVRKYLLREYLLKNKYPKEVISFTMPCNDFTHYMMAAKNKKTDIFFQGNLSNKDRSVLFGKIRKHTKKYNCRYKIMTGGVKNIKDRLPFKKFMKVMGQSKLGLYFSGTGYDCYRYNEIPSVGSIIVTPDYPYVVRNDYEDMKSSIVYSGTKELKTKIGEVLGSNDRLMDMQGYAIERFKKYHTSEVRYGEFKEFINDALQK